MLRERGALEKYSNQFLDAAKQEHVNEVYLISHAILETGNNKSKLANGVLLTDKGKVTNSKEESDGKKYYNFYGVGALDEDPIGTGARYAKKKVGIPHIKQYQAVLSLFMITIYQIQSKILYIV